MLRKSIGFLHSLSHGIIIRSTQCKPAASQVKKCPIALILHSTALHREQFLVMSEVSQQESVCIKHSPPKNLI